MLDKRSLTREEGDTLVKMIDASTLTREQTAQLNAWVHAYQNNPALVEAFNALNKAQRTAQTALGALHAKVWQHRYYPSNPEYSTHLTDDFVTAMDQFADAITTLQGELGPTDTPETYDDHFFTTPHHITAAGILSRFNSAIVLQWEQLKSAHETPTHESQQRLNPIK